jgi:hypothetical protein
VGSNTWGKSGENRIVKPDAVLGLTEVGNPVDVACAKAGVEDEVVISATPHDRSPVVIYACRRGLSNRPARGTFIACSGTGDCGGQVQGKACGGLVADPSVRHLTEGSRSVSGAPSVARAETRRAAMRTLLPFSALLHPFRNIAITDLP